MLKIKQPGSAKHLIEARAFDRFGNLGIASSLAWRLRHARRR